MIGTTYSTMKGTVCHETSCKHEGDCDKCEFGTIREQAARDYDRMIRMKNALERIAWNVDSMTRSEVYEAASEGLKAWRGDNDLEG